MLALSVQSPFASPPPPVGGAEAVAQAIEAAGTVSGAYTEAPCQFMPLDAAAEPLVGALRPAGEAGGSWLLVTVRPTGEDGQRVHLHERCLTAVQRVTLALACEGVESAWIDAGVPAAEAFRAAGVPLTGRVPVGLVWCATG